MGEATGAFTPLVSDDPANFEKERAEKIRFGHSAQSHPGLFHAPKESTQGFFSDDEWKQLQDRHKFGWSTTWSNTSWKMAGDSSGIHAATDACYHHEEFGEAIGGYFDGHPWDAGSNVTIAVEDPDHNFNKLVFGDQKDFQLVEEIYQFKEEPYSRERLRILLHLDPERSDEVKGMKRKDNDYAVAWVQK
jgi:type 1 glutamine amidotransferase